MKKYILLLSVVFVPVITHAQFFANTKLMLASVGGIVNTLTTLAGAFALLFFFWGLAQFISKSGDTAAHEEGKNKMVWGIIALFVIVSIGGIINFLRGEVGFPSNSSGRPCTQDELLDDTNSLDDCI